ncbi:branched-chain amino acid ABC transporter permease [Candidatus Nephthysia bennettiae]|uniref:Branched-chain amino acid ABC transporter permease n=1 Tax=Candidatus Nephthysia bennettiae TaxID=3127016 RepID=A0A934K770_9BACT|nr:branched-chain amino acid ABC transporter permease [Candidatus Dormibacteraeota bacterium]MBJ7613606.1 branched-chain amino acid ABC transporter permease [Candidatus Dormibacteraeota bacterium]
MTGGQLLLFAVGGLASAAYLFIVTAGLSLVFGALRIINMAHGSLYMIAAFITVVVANQLGASLGFWTGLLVAVAVTGVIGAVVEVVVLRRVYGQEHLVQLLGTYALSLIVAGVVRLLFGASYRSVRPPDIVSGSVTVAGFRYSAYSLFMIGAAVVIAVGVYLLLYRTGLGRNIRAAVSDPELLSVTGVDVARLYTTVFVIGAGLAALGGAIVAPSQAVGPTMDTDVLVLAFAISVIGGLGSIVGSVVGALIVGEVISFGLNNTYTNPFALAFVFIVMAAVLTVRPWGLFGKPEQ